MASVASNSTPTIDHLAETLAIVIGVEMVTERNVLDENIAQMILAEIVLKGIASKVIDHREIDPTRIDHPFAATTVRTIPTVPLTAVAAEIDQVEIGHKVIVLPTVRKATDLRIVETTAETDHPIAVVVEIVPVAAIDPHIEVAAAAETDHRTEVVAETDPAAAVDLGLAVAADVLAAAVVLDPAAAVADLHTEVPVAEIVPHEETNSGEAKDVKVKKPRQPKQTKQPI